MLLGGVRGTVEERLSVDGAPLFQLLFHLVRHNLLAETHFAKLDRALIVVAAVRVLATSKLHHVVLIDFLNETAPVLALDSATHLLYLTGVLFGAWLRQLRHLMMRLRFLIMMLDLGGPIAPLHRRLKKVFVEPVIRGSVLMQEGCLG